MNRPDAKSRSSGLDFHHGGERHPRGLCVAMGTEKSMTRYQSALCRARADWLVGSTPPPPTGAPPLHLWMHFRLLYTDCITCHVPFDMEKKYVSPHLTAEYGSVHTPSLYHGKYFLLSHISFHIRKLIQSCQKSPLPVFFRIATFSSSLKIRTVFFSIFRGFALALDWYLSDQFLFFASQKSFHGHSVQSGAPFGTHIVAPSSMSAWLNAPARF